MKRFVLFILGAVLLALPPTFATAQVVKQSKRWIDEMRVERIEPSDMRHEAGFCYTAVLHLGRPGDAPSEGGSHCVLMEDGRPLGPAHTNVADIRARGRGAYAHWFATSLDFSSSDNTDPRKNGRVYTLVSRFRGFRHTAVVTIAAPSASYNIHSGGKGALNRRLTLRNLDSRVAVAPLLRARGSPDLTTREGMIRSILKPGMTPEQKSLGIWKFLVDRTYPYDTPQQGAEIDDPVKLLNVYGYGLCADSAENFALLCETAGLKARIWGLGGHVVAESFYGGAWHMFDASLACYFRGADGHILSVEELEKDPAAINTTPFTPRCSYDSRSMAEFYTTTADNHVRSVEEVKPGHHLDPILEPGDELTFDLGPARLVHDLTTPGEPLPPMAADGTLTRTVKAPAGGGDFLIPVVWPYVILGGELAFSGGGAEDVSISADGAAWTPLAERTDGAARKADLTGWFVGKDARYQFWLRVRGAPRDAKLTVLFQFAPRALPVVRPGTTTFDISLSPVGRIFPVDWKGIEIIHEWDQPDEPAR